MYHAATEIWPQIFTVCAHIITRETSSSCKWQTRLSKQRNANKKLQDMKKTGKQWLYELIRTKPVDCEELWSDNHQTLNLQKHSKKTQAASFTKGKNNIGSLKHFSDNLLSKIIYIQCTYCVISSLHSAIFWKVTYTFTLPTESSKTQIEYQCKMIFLHPD